MDGVGLLTAYFIPDVILSFALFMIEWITIIPSHTMNQRERDKLIPTKMQIYNDFGIDEMNFECK